MFKKGDLVRRKEEYDTVKWSGAAHAHGYLWLVHQLHGHDELHIKSLATGELFWVFASRMEKADVQEG